MAIVHGEGGKPQVNLETMQKLFGGSLIWIAMALLVVVVTLLLSIRVGRVTGEEVGIKLSKISGKLEVVDQPGVHIYNGIFSDFYVLDKTMQTMDMAGGERGDGLKVKTIDGSDVYVDLKVQYRINPSLANTVLITSGPDNAFKEKWVRDYVRSIARNYLGELTTEEFYDSSKRDEKIRLSQKLAREKLEPFGIDIDSIVVPRRPVFYKEYEEMINQKKLADQTVLEEQSKALAAKQKQETQRVEYTNKKNVAIEGFRGKMDKKIIAAKAAADKMMKEADAYFTETTIAAEAQLYEMEKRATGIIERKKAEAEGIEELKKALEGEGGRNMVKLEYAKKLKDVNIGGQPFTYDGQTERFQHLGASTRGAPKR